MNTSSTSRRDLLKLGGAAAAGMLLGAGGREAARFLTGPEAPGPENALAADRETVQPKAIIDVHVHVVASNLPGSLTDPVDRDLRAGTPEQVAKTIQAQLREAGIEHALGMPGRELRGDDALGVDATRRLAAIVPGLHPIGMADPERFDDKHLGLAEDQLRRGDVVALKAYLGYLHHGPDSPGYRPYYRLAAKYKIPLIFHTGDTYSHLAKLKYAHPLPIDEVAVDYPETDFVLAHLGNPWLMDAAELVYKNNKPGFRENVWADLSGLIVGSAEDFERYRQQGVLKSVNADIRKAIEFAERPDRFLFGSDWPLAPIVVYRDWIRELLPEPYHQAVFYDNAKKLFKL